MSTLVYAGTRTQTVVCAAPTFLLWLVVRA